MAISIRPGTLHEAPDVLALWRVAEAQPSRTDTVAFLEALMDFDPDALLVAEEHGVILGSVIAAWDGWRGAIYRLVVHPRHRRRGLARRLLAAAEEHLASRRATRLAAIVVDDDPPAVGFWRASGWEEQTHRVRFVKG